MTMRIAFCVALLLMPRLSAAQSGRADVNEPTVMAGVFMVRPDGTLGGSASQTARRAGDDIKGVVYLGACQYGARPSVVDLTAAAIDAWQLSGKVLSMSGDEASVQIEWQRVRRGGVDESAAPRLQTLTLRPGERVTLETTALPSNSCGEGHASFEVAYIARSQLWGKVEAAGAKTTVLGVMAAELWLVHSAPGRADDTLHLNLPTGPDSRVFAFAPISIQTPAGSLRVKVEGALQALRAPDAQWVVNFSANRGVTFVPTDRPPRDSAPLVEGSTKTTVRLTSPDEVLSFEMPPLRVPGGAALPDRLSIRIRLTPVTYVVKKK